MSTENFIRVVVTQEPLPTAWLNVSDRNFFRIE